MHSVKPKYTIACYKSKNGWRARIKHRNGKIILCTSEAYRRRVDMLMSISRFAHSVFRQEYEIVGPGVNP